MDWRFRDAWKIEDNRIVPQAGSGIAGGSTKVRRRMARLCPMLLLAALGLVVPGTNSLAGACEHNRCETRLAQAAESDELKRTKGFLVRLVTLLHEGRTKRQRGDLSGAIGSFNAALAVTDDWIAQDPDDNNGRSMRALVLQNYGSALYAQGDLASALVFFGQALQVRKDIAADYAADPKFQRRLAKNYDWIGLVHSASGHTRQALESYLAGMRILKDLAERSPEDAARLRDLALAHGTLANVWYDLGETDKALEHAGAYQAISEELLSASPDDKGRLTDLALSLHNIGQLHYRQGDYQAAYESFNKCGEITRDVIVEKSDRTDRKRLFGRCLYALGEAQSMLGRMTIALANYRLSLVVAEGLAEKDPDDIESHLDVISGHRRVAQLYDVGTIGRDEALLHLKKALKVVEELEGSGRLAPRYAWLAGDVRESLEALGR